MTNDNRPQGAPGCYGFAVTFDAEDKVCQSCVYMSRCSLAAGERKDLITRLLKYLNEGKTAA